MVPDIDGYMVSGMVSDRVFQSRNVILDRFVQSIGFFQHTIWSRLGCFRPDI